MLMMCGKEFMYINVFLIILIMYILDGLCGDVFVKGIEVFVRIVVCFNRIEGFFVVDFLFLIFYGNIINCFEESIEGMYCLSGLFVFNSVFCFFFKGVCCDCEYDLVDIELNYIMFSYEGV